MGCKRVLWRLVRDGIDLDERIEYDIKEDQRRMAALKWSSLAVCLTSFVLYGFVVG